MVKYTRRRYTRRSTLRRIPRVTRKLNATGRILRPRRLNALTRPSNVVHSFKRMFASPTSIVGNAVYNPYLSAYSFSLGQIVNSSEFANLYDQYRINYIVTKFWLKIDPSAQSAATSSFPKFYWYRDWDDATNPASLQELRENSRTKVVVMNPNRPVVVAFKPNVLQTLFNSGVTSTYKAAFNQWLDMSNTNTTHYGFKFAIDDLTNTNYKVDVEIVYYFQCRQPR